MSDPKSPNSPSPAVEAVAQTIYKEQSYYDWNAATSEIRDRWRSLARSAIDAYHEWIAQQASKVDDRTLQPKPRFGDGRPGGLGDPLVSGPVYGAEGAEIDLHVHGAKINHPVFDKAAAALKPVLQEWVMELPLMQQTVLLTAVRGPDDMPKYGPVKLLMRWYRRCVLLSAFDRTVLPNPTCEGGGSFMGPSMQAYGAQPWEFRMNALVDEYLDALDALPQDHFQMHFMHAAEILGYKHPDVRIRAWWAEVYLKLVKDMHVHPETAAEMDARLGDNLEATR